MSLDSFSLWRFYILDQSLLGKKLCQKLKLWINASHCNYSLNCLNSAPVHRFECSLPSHCFERRQWCAPSFLPLKSKPWTKGWSWWWTVGCKQRRGIKCFAEDQDHRMLMTNTFDVCKKTRQGTEGVREGVAGEPLALVDLATMKPNSRSQWLILFIS